MTLDVTTLALAVDSSQVTTANAALDKMAAAGTRAEGAATKLAAATTAQGRALSGTLVPGANKAVAAFKTLAEAQETLGPAAAAQLAAAGAFGAVEARANSAATAVHRLGEQAQDAAAKTRGALAVAASGHAPAAITPAPRPVGAREPIHRQPQPDSRAAGAVSQKDVDATKALAAASTTAAGSVKSLREAEEALALATARSAAAQASVAAATQRNAQAQAQLAAVLANSSSSQDQIAKAQGRAAAAQATLLAAQARVGTTHQAAAKATETHSKALANLGNASKLTANQTQQLAFQINDFFVQVASGGSPLTALIQQGSQLSGTFGGVGNAVRAVLSLITPVRLAMAGAAAGVGAFALALISAESAARSLNAVQAQLAATGRQELFGGDAGLKAFIAELAQAPGVTRESAAQIVSELAKVRDVGGDVFKNLAVLAVDFAKATGTDLPTAVRTFGRAFSDPAKGAKELDDALNGAFSTDQLLRIEKFAREGDKLGAQRAMFEALTGAIKGTADKALTPLEKSTNDLGNTWDRVMDRFKQSEGLRSANELLAKTIEGVRWLLDNADKVGGLGNIGLSTVPGIGPAAAVGNAVRAQFGPSLLERVMGSSQAGGASGSWDAPQAGTPGGTVRESRAATGAAAGKKADETTKQILQETEAYRRQAGEIGRLTNLRARLTKEIEKAATAQDKDTAAGKLRLQELRASLQGVNEDLAARQRRGAGRTNSEPDQIRREELAAKVESIQAVFERERNAQAFQNRFLQGEYQAGNRSLADYLDERRGLIEKGVAAEVKALEDRKQAIQADLAAPGRVKDPSERLHLEREVQKITNDQGEVRERGAEAVKLANQEAAQSFKQLNDQVLNYRATLLQMQADEAGAARIRTQLALEQARALDRQLAVQRDKTAGDFARTDRGQSTPGPLERVQAQVSAQQDALNEAKTRTSTINQRLQLEEERISIAQRTGAITTLDSLQQVSAARRAAVTQLEQQAAKMDELLDTERLNARLENRPVNLTLELETERARLELEQLRAEINPLQQQFGNLFKGSSTNAIGDLLNGRFAQRDEAGLDRRLNDIDRDFGRRRERIAGDPRLSSRERDRQLMQLDRERDGAERKARDDAKPGALNQVKRAVEQFSVQIANEINGVVARQFTEQLFKPGGVFGDAGGIFAKLFGGENKPKIDTAPVQTSLNRLASAGIDPAVSALGRLEQAASGAAAAIGQGTGLPAGTVPLGREPVAGVIVGASTGDFSRMDRGQVPAGEQSVFELFRDAERSAEDMARSNALATTAVTQLANAAGKGGGALSLLPAIINAIQAAATFSNASSSGGSNLIGTIIGAFAGSGGGADLAGAGGGAGNYNFGGGFAKGGYTGNKDVDQVAGVVHGKEVVFSAPAVRTIGKDALLAAHDKAAKGEKPSLFADVGRYHSGGIVERTTAAMPGLKANEVPAVLMGGPKGTREEVLTAADPRHRDNLTPKLAEVFAVAPRYHTGGLVGQEADRSSLLPIRERRHLTPELEKASEAERKGPRGGASPIIVNVTQPPGAARDTGMQFGSAIGKQIQHARRRNG